MAGGGGGGGEGYFTKMIKINISLEAMRQLETIWHSKPQKSNQINPQL